MATSKLQDELKITHFDCDPNATTATEAGWVDMCDFENLLVTFLRRIGTSAATLKLMANTESDGSGTDVDIVEHAVASEPDAVNDWLVLECSAADIAQKAADAGVSGARYVTAVYSFATGTDEAVATYVQGGAKRQYNGMTADSVA